MCFYIYNTNNNLIDMQDEKIRKNVSKDISFATPYDCN